MSSKCVHNVDDMESVASSVIGSSPHVNTTANEMDHERLLLARKENLVVVWMKVLVSGVLLIATISVSWGVYAYTHGEQVKNFEGAFQADDVKLLESFHQCVSRQLNELDALGSSITAHALSTGATFPNVSLPSFEVAFGNSRILSGASSVHYTPIVQDEDRLGYEAYYRDFHKVYDQALSSETMLLQQQDKQFTDQYQDKEHRNLPTETTGDAFHDQIVNFNRDGSTYVAPYGSGPLVPLMVISPVVPIKGFFNTNSLTHPFAAEGKELLTTPKAAIGIPVIMDDASSIFLSNMLKRGQYRYEVDAYLKDPVSAVFYPVFDTFNVESRKVVGIVCAGMYWRLNFENVLPDNARGIICVLHNTRGQSFTFRIDQNVTFLGMGDHHDRKYDYMAASTNIATYITKMASPETRLLTSVDLNTEYSSYMLYVYPSSDTEALHVNQTPLVIAATMVGVFMFTSMVFVLFTIAVNRRQTVVMDRAIASGAIVASLFPSQVRDKIYQERQQAVADAMEEGTVDVIAQGAKVDKPIADLFENTTVMFADMVGFTKWSFTRTPVEVFELLEATYQGFDAIAVRRNVFKVETIGDCYVAVAGLPEPQDDHAIIMAKFAADCMVAMGQVTTQLSSSLGADTADLTIRVGLHSGSVTGGVLRGQKSRFQLFGDTMNTASRMESTGTPGRIHCSQETAHALIGKGKSSWVMPRSDKVVAKGIGELQTYWVIPKSVATSVNSSPSSKHTSPLIEL